MYKSERKLRLSKVGRQKNGVQHVYGIACRLDGQRRCAHVQTADMNKVGGVPRAYGAPATTAPAASRAGCGACADAPSVLLPTSVGLRRRGRLVASPDPSWPSAGVCLRFRAAAAGAGGSAVGCGVGTIGTVGSVGSACLRGRPILAGGYLRGRPILAGARTGPAASCFGGASTAVSAVAGAGSLRGRPILAGARTADADAALPSAAASSRAGTVGRGCLRGRPIFLAAAGASKGRAVFVGEPSAADGAGATRRLRGRPPLFFFGAVAGSAGAVLAPGTLAEMNPLSKAQSKAKGAGCGFAD